MYNSDQNQTSDNTDPPSAAPSVSPFHLSRFHVLTFLTPSPPISQFARGFLRTFPAPKSQRDFWDENEKVKNSTVQDQQLRSSILARSSHFSKTSLALSGTLRHASTRFARPSHA